MFLVFWGIVFLIIAVASFVYVFKIKSPKLKKQQQMPITDENVVILDTETTGLTDNDEMVELAIVNFYGKVLFNNRIKPKHKKSWQQAQSIHGISPADVQHLPTIDTYREQIKNITKDKIIVGYNINFDYKFLEREDLLYPNFYTLDVMKPFAKIKGEWSDYHGDYKFQKLTTCANYFGYKWEGTAHGALADTKATLFCFKEMLKDKSIFWNVELHID